MQYVMYKPLGTIYISNLGITTVWPFSVKGFSTPNESWTWKYRRFKMVSQSPDEEDYRDIKSTHFVTRNRYQTGILILVY